MYNKYCRIRLTSLILFLLASCKAPASLQPAASATLQPSETLPPTATVVPTETPTPLPTATPTSTETPVPTDTPTATLDLKATEAAQATADAKAEEEGLVAEVVKELETYNIPTSEGGLIFHSDGPFHITADEYNETNYIALDPGVTYGEYVMHVDVKWESTSGLAGCGIRIHGKNIKDGDYFTFQTLRFSGLPAWAVSYVQDGIFQFNATGKVRFNDSIDLRQGSVNSYVLVVERALLTLYANTKKLGAVDTNRRRSGEIAFEAFQESGMTNCTLEHIWVWSLK